MGEHRMPGLVVTDGDGKPHSVLGASQVVRFLVPKYVQDDPALAGVLDEQFADKVAEKLAGHSVRDLLPEDRPELAMAEADDTIIEVAAVMARTRCPLVAVVENDRVIGVITASRLLEHALPQ
jgi:CBS domain-containing protein